MMDADTFIKDEMNSIFIEKLKQTILNYPITVESISNCFPLLGELSAIGHRPEEALRSILDLAKQHSR